jgi:hypothetical protein
MDESQRKIAIVISGILILMLALLLLSSLFKGTRKKPIENNERPVISKKQSPPKTTEQKQTTVSAPISNAPSNHQSPFTETDIEEITSARTEAERLLRIANDQWLLKQVNDPALNERTREKYRLKTLDSYMDGMLAFESGNYKESIQHLLKSLKDPAATPVSQYLILIYLRSAATRLKNFDLFLEFSKVQAELVNKQDLSPLGIEKSDTGLTYCSELEDIFKAATSESGFRKIVQKRMFDEGHLNLDIRAVEKSLNREIEEFKKDFGGFFSYD